MPTKQWDIQRICRQKPQVFDLITAGFDTCSNLFDDFLSFLLILRVNQQFNAIVSAENRVTCKGVS